MKWRVVEVLIVDFFYLYWSRKIVSMIPVRIKKMTSSPTYIIIDNNRGTYQNIKSANREEIKVHTF